ncbi:hypothetical protein [Actinophytocola sediminis]
MTAMDYALTLGIAVFIGVVVGPPLGYWSVRWEDKLDRHRAQCASCRRRAERRAARHV